MKRKSAAKKAKKRSGIRIKTLDKLVKQAKKLTKRKTIPKVDNSAAKYTNNWTPSRSPYLTKRIESESSKLHSDLFIIISESSRCIWISETREPSSRSIRVPVDYGTSLEDMQAYADKVAKVLLSKPAIMKRDYIVQPDPMGLGYHD